MAYTANMDEASASWLAGLDEPQGITHLGNGKVRFSQSAYSYLRNVPPHMDVHIDSHDRICLSEGSYQLTRS